MKIRGVETKPVIKTMAKAYKNSNIKHMIVGCGNFQRTIALQRGTHLTQLSVFLPNSLSPLGKNCTECGQGAVLLREFADIVKIPHNKLIGTMHYVSCEIMFSIYFFFFNTGVLLSTFKYTCKSNIPSGLMDTPFPS